MVRGRVEAMDSGVVFEKGRAHVNGGLSIRVARRASNSFAQRGSKAPDAKIEKEVSKVEAKSRRVYTRPDLPLNESDSFELLERSALQGASIKSPTKSGKQIPGWQIGPWSPPKPSSQHYLKNSKSPLKRSQGSVISEVYVKPKVSKKCVDGDGTCVVPKKALLELSAYLTAFFDMLNLRKDIEQMSKAPHVLLAICLQDTIEILLEYDQNFKQTIRDPKRLSSKTLITIRNAYREKNEVWINPVLRYPKGASPEELARFGQLNNSHLVGQSDKEIEAGIHIDNSEFEALTQPIDISLT